jgi:hypothetical protein
VAFATDTPGNMNGLEADNIRQVIPTGEETTVADPVFGPRHLQDQFCEWDIPPEDSGSARTGTRRCALGVGTTYCSSSIEGTSANPSSTKPKLSPVYDGRSSLRSRYGIQARSCRKRTCRYERRSTSRASGAASWLHYAVTVTVSSTIPCE